MEAANLERKDSKPFLVTARPGVELNGAPFQATADAAGDVLFIRDATGRFLWANSACPRFTGLEPQDIIGRSLSDLFNPETAAHQAKEDAAVLETGQPSSCYEVMELNEQRVAFLVSRWPFLGVNGKPIGVVSIARQVFRKGIHNPNGNVGKVIQERRTREVVRQQDLVEICLLKLASKRITESLHLREDWIFGVLQRGGTVETGPHTAQMKTEGTSWRVDVE